MKQQINVRLSESSRSKLEFLTERYGTQTTALEVAIDRLYTREKGRAMPSDTRLLSEAEIAAFPGDASVNVAIRSRDGREYYGDFDGSDSMFISDDGGDYIPIQ